MKHSIFTRLIVLLAVILTLKTSAQQDCSFQPPVVKIDFGTGDIPDMNTYLSKYERDFSTCPNDGFYSFASHTSNCFNNDWFTLSQDHSGNTNGNMMLVNASQTGGVFFNTNLNGFKGNTLYRLTLSLMNVCRINGGCAPLPPNITIYVMTAEGKQIALLKTGRLAQGHVPQWKQLAGFFRTPAGASSLRLIMENTTLGGCGNDFAMDDIVISECITREVKPAPAPLAQKPVQQNVIQEKPVIKPPLIKKDTVKPQQPKKDTQVFISVPSASKPVIVADAPKQAPILKLPEPVLSRANPVIKQIETAAGEFLIELYDNGDIDGDTVTIYHNNRMVVSKAGLSARPVSFHLVVDEKQPHHELIMVADNLGSIPPNTSTMIITANGRRYEVFISSSEQKNAKVVIDLKK